MIGVIAAIATRSHIVNHESRMTNHEWSMSRLRTLAVVAAPVVIVHVFLPQIFAFAVWRSAPAGVVNWLPALYLATLVAMAVATCYFHPGSSLSNLGLMASGLPLYLIWRWRSKIGGRA